MTHDEAIANLKAFVAGDYDGGIEANFRLDELLWEVRKWHPHNYSQTEPAAPASPDEIVIDLEELGL